MCRNLTNTQNNVYIYNINCNEYLLWKLQSSRRRGEPRGRDSDGVSEGKLASRHHDYKDHWLPAIPAARKQGTASPHLFVRDDLCHHIHSLSKYSILRSSLFFNSSPGFPLASICSDGAGDTQRVNYPSAIVSVRSNSLRRLNCWIRTLTALKQTCRAVGELLQTIDVPLTATTARDRYHISSGKVIL